MFSALWRGSKADAFVVLFSNCFGFFQSEGFMLCEHEPGDMALLSFIETVPLMMAEGTLLVSLLRLISVHFSSSSAHISSCAFKEQDLASRQAVEFAEGERRGKLRVN